MRNGYFQLVCGQDGTSLKIFAPQEGGALVETKEAADYLTKQGVQFDLTALNKGVQDAMLSKTEEYTFSLNSIPLREVRESYDLYISPDKMTVTARFYPPSVKGEHMTCQEFLTDLAHKNIKYGIRKSALEVFFTRQVYCMDMVVAQGKPPRHGEDARIEYYFETDIHAKPTLKEDGSVDFFNLNTLNHCKKGDVLAKLIPEDPGEYGITVTEEKVKPRDVKHQTLKYGNNITISEDKKTLVSEVDGHVTLVQGKVFVSNVLEVENVDSATGNIEYQGSVKVNGNVATNFSVKASGNIEVKGVVEGAYLEAGENIIIARGMNGMARGILKAEGNIISKFIENAKAYAGGYVQTESILHSEVTAGTEINVSGKRGFITGGKVSAASVIRVKTLGSSMGADTTVEVGADPKIKLRIQQLQKQVAEDKKTIESIHPVVVAMAQKLSKGVKLTPEQTKNLQEMLVAEKSKTQAVEDAMAELEALQENMHQSDNARVEVTGEVYGGTRICIADVSMVVKNTMSYCKFVKSQGDVKKALL